MSKLLLTLLVLNAIAGNKKTSCYLMAVMLLREVAK